MLVRSFNNLLIICSIYGISYYLYPYYTKFQKQIIYDHSRYFKILNYFPFHLIKDSNNNLYLINKDINKKLIHNNIYNITGYGFSFTKLHIYPKILKIEN